MQRISLEVKVSVLLIFATFVVIGSGYLSYKSLSHIVSSIHKEISPDLVLLNIKDINYQLNKAENNVNLYIVTGEGLYSKSYNLVVSSVNDKVGILFTLAETKKIKEEKIDSIFSLITERILIWDEILKLSDEKRNYNTISLLSDQIFHKGSQPEYPPKNFFQKFFGRNKRKKSENIMLVKLREDLEQAERKAILRDDKIKAKERFLIQKNEELAAKLNLFISEIEEKQNKALLNKANEADYLAKSTYRWLTIFCLSGILLIILVLLVVFNYVRKTKSYQKALIDAKNEARELAKAKELFVANVSHEIRSPMNAVIGLTDQLYKREHKTDIKNQLNIVNQSANDLLRIINDILDFSKIHAGKLMLEKVNFDLRKLFKETFELNRVLAQKKKLGFHLSFSNKIPDAVLGDPLRIKQILLNLLNNSIKFTAKGKISLQVTSEKISKKDLMLRFIVRDTGIGIAKDKIPIIFKEFAQSGLNISRDYGGTGLGLAIVYQLVTLHGGNIEVESELNKGSKFTVTLPLQKGKNIPAKVEKDQYKKRTTNFRNLSALIVDDEEYNRTLLKVILEKLKIPYEEASNGAQAIEACKSKHFDIILMDIRMPVMDGIEAAKRILELNRVGKKSPVKIIAITAINSDTEIEKYRNAGINKFLIKPYKEEDLIQIFHDLSKMSEPATIQNDNKKSKQFRKDDQPDLSELKKLANGDINFLHTMLEIYIETSQDGIANIKMGIESGDYVKIADAAHKMVSPSRHLKANTLVITLKQIETIAESKDNMKMLIEKLEIAEKELNRYVAIIKKEIEKINVNKLYERKTL